MPLLTDRSIALIAGFLLAGLSGFGQSAASNPINRAKIATLSKMFLRDSAELPMDVTVTTVITDRAGREKRRSQSSVHFLFHGYNQQAEKFSFDSHSGWFNTGALRDSFSGDLAVFAAFGELAPKKNGDADFEMIQQDLPGQGIFIKTSDPDCHDFEMSDRFLYPKKYCSSVEFHVGTDSAGQLSVERFTLQIGNLPAAGKIVYLGAVQIRSIRAEGDIQKAYLPNDPLPFLVPRQVVTSIETDKGKIVLTNLYTLPVDRARKH